MEHNRNRDAQVLSAFQTLITATVEYEDKFEPDGLRLAARDVGLAALHWVRAHNGERIARTENERAAVETLEEVLTSYRSRLSRKLVRRERTPIGL